MFMLLLLLLLSKEKMLEMRWLSMVDHMRWRPRNGERIGGPVRLTVQLIEGVHAMVEGGGSVERTGCTGLVLDGLVVADG